MSSAAVFETMAIPSAIGILLVGVGLLAITPETAKNRLRGIAFAATTMAFVIGVLMFLRFNWQSSEWQFTYEASWIPSIGAHISFGVDGISLPLLLLTLFSRTVMCACVNWRN